MMSKKGGSGSCGWGAVRVLVLAAALGCCLWLAWNVPYTHDDWDWGQPIGLEWWRTGAMNNRYAGSFFAVVMTRSRLVKTLVMGGVMFALPLLAAAVAAPGRDRFALCLLGGGLLTAMPAVSWRQTYGWVSAFSNFVVLGVWMLLLILLARRWVVEGKGGWRGGVPAVPAGSDGAAVCGERHRAGGRGRGGSGGLELEAGREPSGGAVPAGGDAAGAGADVL